MHRKSKVESRMSKVESRKLQSCRVAELQSFRVGGKREIRKQMAERRKQKAEDRMQKADGRK